MQYVVTAMDFADSEALSRRIACRDAHLAGLKKMAAEGTFLSGGAILDVEGRMIGSSAHVEFENRGQLDQWLQNDPYTVGKVWDQIDVREVRLLPVNQFKQI
ncbi:MAG: YciI family protein [Polaromonas sp.]